MTTFNWKSRKSVMSEKQLFNTGNFNKNESLLCLICRHSIFREHSISTLIRRPNSVCHYKHREAAFLPSWTQRVPVDGLEKAILVLSV